MTWDEYFYAICQVVGSRSRCLSRKIGAILVVDNVIVCTGYNGPARGIPHCERRYDRDEYLMDSLQKAGVKWSYNNPQCPRRVMGFETGKGLELCIAAHAERNCLIQAARLGIKTRGASLYMNCPIPCGDCLIEIINAGVKEVVVTKKEFYDEKSKYMVKYANKLTIREFTGDTKDESYRAEPPDRVRNAGCAGSHREGRPDLL